MASIGDKLFVFAGGQSGPDPVTDTQMHVFNTGNNNVCMLQNFTSFALLSYIR